MYELAAQGDTGIDAKLLDLLMFMHLYSLHFYSSSTDARFTLP